MLHFLFVPFCLRSLLTVAPGGSCKWVLMERWSRRCCPRVPPPGAAPFPQQPPPTALTPTPVFSSRRGICQESADIPKDNKTRINTQTLQGCTDLWVTQIYISFTYVIFGGFGSIHWLHMRIGPSEPDITHRKCFFWDPYLIRTLKPMKYNLFSAL